MLIVLGRLFYPKFFRLSEMKMFFASFKFSLLRSSKAPFQDCLNKLFIALCIEKQVVIERVFLNESAINLIYFLTEFPY